MFIFVYFKTKIRYLVRRNQYGKIYKSLYEILSVFKEFNEVRVVKCKEGDNAA